MLFYRSSLPLSRQTLNYTTGVVRRHRTGIGSRRRALSPGAQALMVLVYLRKSETFAEVGGVRGPHLDRMALYQRDRAVAGGPPPKATRDGLLYLVLDGTLIPIDWVAADRPFYSGKHRRHGMNLQVIAAPDRTIVWVSGALPGSVHDLTAARIWGIPRALETAGFLVLADKAYQGADGPLLIPYRGTGKPASQKDANRGPRPTSCTRRTRERAAQALGHPPQAPLLPTPSRPPRQSHPRPTHPRSPNPLKELTGRGMPLRRCRRDDGDARIAT